MTVVETQSASFNRHYAKTQSGFCVWEKIFSYVEAIRTTDPAELYTMFAGWNGFAKIGVNEVEQSNLAVIVILSFVTRNDVPP